MNSTHCALRILFEEKKPGLLCVTERALCLWDVHRRKQSKWIIDYKNKERKKKSNGPQTNY